jgi:biopolymer transport protein TolR
MDKKNDSEIDLLNDDTFESFSQINVTPLVDVMLVLLIVFMVTAPLIQHGVSIELPKAATKEMKTDETSLILVITKNKDLLINKHKFQIENLSEKIKVIYENKNSKDIFIKADKNINYGFVIDVMAELKKAGLNRIGLVTLPE